VAFPRTAGVCGGGGALPRKSKCDGPGALDVDNFFEKEHRERTSIGIPLRLVF
jgi:hypothetical protein